MKANQMNPTTLKKILISILITILVISGFGFYRTQDLIRQLASETSSIIKKTNTTESSSNEVNDSETKQLANIASNITYSSVTTKDQIEKDLRHYTSDYGIEFIGISQSVDSAQGSPIPLINSVKAKKFDIKLSSPLPFDKLMLFMRAVETNNPKIQITKLDLSNTNANAGAVTVTPITIEVYTR